MKWTKGFRKDPKSLIKQKNILSRLIERNRTMLESSGAPMTAWFRNRSGQRCYCFPDGKTTPDARHQLCGGLGYLNGWQKYGYTDNTWASSHTGLTLSNVRVGSAGGRGRGATNRNNILVLAGGTSGTITTPEITLTDWKAHSFFTHDENIIAGSSAVTYEYSCDGSWWRVVPEDASTIVASSTGTIQFRATLARASTSVRVPSVKFMKYRFRILDSLATLDSRFPLAVIPSFMASRSKPSREIRQREHGFETVWPTRYWCIDAPVEEGTIGMFLYGELADLRFDTTNLLLSTHGDEQAILHREWETRFVKDEADVTGIIYSLV